MGAVVDAVTAARRAGSGSDMVLTGASPRISPRGHRVYAGVCHVKSRVVTPISSQPAIVNPIQIGWVTASSRIRCGHGCRSREQSSDAVQRPDQAADLARGPRSAPTRVTAGRAGQQLGIEDLADRVPRAQVLRSTMDTPVAYAASRLRSRRSTVAQTSEHTRICRTATHHLGQHRCHGCDRQLSPAHLGDQRSDPVTTRNRPLCHRQQRLAVQQHQPTSVREPSDRVAAQSSTSRAAHSRVSSGTGPWSRSSSASHSSTAAPCRSG